MKKKKNIQTRIHYKLYHVINHVSFCLKYKYSLTTYLILVTKLSKGKVCYKFLNVKCTPLLFVSS